MAGWVVLLALGGLVVYNVVTDYFSAPKVHSRQLKSAPVVPISGLKPGVPAKIVGSVRPTGPTLTSPLRRAECVYYRTDVRAKRSVGKGALLWKLIFRQEDAVPFLVEDATGTVRVRVTIDPLQPRGLDRSIELVDWTSASMPPEAIGRLEKLGERQGGFPGPGPYRPTEAAITVGTTVTLFGVFDDAVGLLLVSNAQG